MRHFVIHESQSRTKQIEVMEVFANDPNDERTVTLCTIEGHTAEAKNIALAVIRFLKRRQL